MRDEVGIWEFGVLLVSLHHRWRCARVTTSWMHLASLELVDSQKSSD